MNREESIKNILAKIDSDLFKHNKEYELYSQFFNKESNAPKNKFAQSDNEEEYKKELKPYRHHITTEKSDRKPKDRHWKLHLNVEPQDCKTVSKYLIDNKYNHKYLFGGDVSNGKIFTVYIGSFAKALTESDNLYQDLRSVLKKPQTEHSVLFNERISGRFSNSGSNEEEFIREGVQGFPHHNIKYESNQEAKNKKVKTGFEILKNKYGPYFFDHTKLKK